MDLTGLLSIVIPTYNRCEYLVRLLKYYDSYGFPARIIILDSSSATLQQQRDLLHLLNHNSVEHLKFSPVIPIAEKIGQGIQDISTPYAVLCGDDDFITPIGLEKSVNFLERNADYVAAHGRYIAFEQDKGGEPHAVEWKKCYGNKSIESDDCENRLLAHLSDYKTPTFYAVHRTKILKSIWIATTEHTNDNGRFGELLLTGLTVLYGKIKVLDDLYSAREYMSSSEGRSSRNFFDYIFEDSFDAKYERFKKCLADTLCDRTDMDHAACKKLVDRAMNGYLKKSYGMPMNALRFRALIKKSMIGKMIDSIGLLTAYRKVKGSLKRCSNKSAISSGIPYDNPTHPCYAAFSRIREAINSGV